jgi:hypothetical protein
MNVKENLHIDLHNTYELTDEQKCKDGKCLFDLLHTDGPSDINTLYPK